MQFFKGDLKAKQELKIPFETERLTLSNLGDSDLFYNFGAKAEDGLKLLAKTGRQLNFSRRKINLHVISEEGTTLQVDTLNGPIFQVGAALLSNGGGSEVEPPKQQEIVVSPYFPLPYYDEEGVNYDNFAISHSGPFYTVYYFNGILFKDGDTYKGDGSYIEFTQSGFQSTWEEGWESTDVYIYTGNGDPIFATRQDIKNESDNKVVRKASKFATWNDNKNVEGFYPKSYLNLPLKTHATWVLYESDGVVKLAYVHGFLSYKEGVLSASETGFKSYIFSDGQYADDEDNIFSPFTVEITLEGIRETGHDIADDNLIIVKHRSAFKVVN